MVVPNLVSNQFNESLSANLKSCPLEKALSYQNDDIVYKFLEQYDISFDEANDIFLETKKWLWLCGQPTTEKLHMSESLWILDEMWHNFVLFTREYTNYCHDCFGKYIHHAPTPQSEKEQRKKQYEQNPTDAIEKQAQSQRQQYTLIYDKLGQATLLKWFVEYPVKYGKDFFNHHRKSMPFNWKPTPEFQALAAHLQAGQKVVITKK